MRTLDAVEEVLAMADVSFKHIEDREPESLIETALRTGRVVVVGHGIVGHQIVYSLFSAARRASSPIQILWIADRHDHRIASFGATGWHMPFLHGDPRIATWARRSFLNWPMLTELGFGNFLARTESVYLTRERGVHIPAGHPGTAMSSDPTAYSAPFYRRANFLDDGSIISTCSLMPKLYAAVEKLPGVTTRLLHLRDLGELLAVTAEFGAEIACVAAGDRAQFLLGDKRIEGDLGILLLVDIRKVPAPFDRIVLMDQDRDHELTYSIPHRACGHVCLGGASGRLVTEPEEYDELERGLADPARAPGYITEAVREIRDRVFERFPAFGPALAGSEIRYWYGLRPSAERAIAEWVPRGITGHIGVLHLGGLAGCGFTVVPAFVADGLAIRRPTPGMEAHLGRPTPAHSV
ncbi:FAD-dependent oxidoreductase [Nocardia arthritidis]|uniref:D-amino-acid oxidase n=1 Tax=Nocardia arthritidis TaxID=228602 RepID=A0A6G9YEJ5_9NOCA|nr:FAD-dependent oxidoreductase [Nocardia arthritidis]QIS11466.1 FAD-dependent oxidoreductase [Nocardia arthritidis]